ncbi:GNAT family N-acetyltransferase [Curtobacterium sp. L1-20]|uniref:GNAT family N-acetyltransferase n=1 Tax=Curtobacterium sp. L1-20 TaxID=3138181 RepID=UPI003B52566E
MARAVVEPPSVVRGVQSISSADTRHQRCGEVHASIAFMSDFPPQLPSLAGRLVRLREWRPSDVAVVQEASRDPLIPLITTVPVTDGKPEALAFVERQSARLRTGAGYAFAIANANDVAVGHVGLFFASGQRTRASAGYWVARSSRRRGYAADALQTITRRARTHDDLDRLELYIEPWNEGSLRAAELAGYQREGLMRAWQRVGGEPRDMLMYAQLNQHVARNAGATV